MAVEKNIIDVSVEDRFVGVGDYTRPVAGNCGVDYVRIALDAEWDGLKAYVTFAGSSSTPTTVDYSADPIEVPWEQIEEAGELYIAVQGLDPSASVEIVDGEIVADAVPTLNAMAMTVPIFVEPGGDSSGALPQQPTNGTLQRVEADILALEAKTTAATDAAGAANAAAAKAEQAAAEVTGAVEAATNAAGLANDAAASANDSKAKADSAASSAKAAAEAAGASASAADEAAATARQAAAAANDVVDDEAGHRAAAKASADAAAASASAAKSSDEAAAASAAKAAGSEKEAASSSESAASSASDSAASASSAALSEASAASSASAAASSASASGESAARAESAAGRAEAIASFSIDSEVTAGSPNPVSGDAVASAIGALSLSAHVDGSRLVIGIGGR